MPRPRRRPSLHRPFGAGGRTVWRRGATGASVGVPVLLLLSYLLPSYAAAPTAATVLKAPYLGVVNHEFTNILQSGCVKTNVADARWNNSSGIGGFSTRDTVSSCAAGPSGSVGVSKFLITGVSALLIPFRIPTTAVGAVTVVANISWNGTMYNHTDVRWNCPAGRWNATTSSGGSSCTVVSVARVNGSIAIYDATQRRVVSPGFVGILVKQTGTLYSEDNCFSYACYWSNYSFAYTVGNLTGVTPFSAEFTPAPGHVYDAFLYVETQVSDILNGFANSSGTVGTNVGTQGHSWNVTSITIA